MSLTPDDIATLRAQALHDLGKCEGPGWCELCEEDGNASDDANREMGIEERLENVGDK